MTTYEVKWVNLHLLTINWFPLIHHPFLRAVTHSAALHSKNSWRGSVSCKRNTACRGRGSGARLGKALKRRASMRASSGAGPDLDGLCICHYENGPLGSIRKVRGGPPCLPREELWWESRQGAWKVVLSLTNREAEALRRSFFSERKAIERTLVT